ncbi:hypothetical protein JTB14_028255 [Gonioctena quinquepunctata]|nr:hypothetical protein JTB14_028255 [Gonioctena quinquepunctata]
MLAFSELRPELRASLRSPNEFSTTEELVRVASKVEIDIQENRKGQVYIATHLRQNYNEKTDNPCRYCQEIHSHRDFPQNPYNSGNFQRAFGNRTGQQKLALPDQQAQH